MPKPTNPTTTELLKRNIKDIIRQFPKVADVLNDYGIGCVSCSLGTCLLEDIVTIHDLTAEDEMALLSALAGVIAPDSTLDLPARPPKTRIAPPRGYSPPLRKLVDEHKVIKRWVGLIPAFISRLDVATEEGRQLIRRAIDFIRAYADKYHHAKEEAVLFKYFDENLEIIRIMLADHEKARGLVREMGAALERRDSQALAASLKDYAALLTEHITKEDEVLYRWMDRNLTTHQVGRLFSRFEEIDREFATTIPQHERFIAQLEQDLKEVT